MQAILGTTLHEMYRKPLQGTYVRPETRLSAALDKVRVKVRRVFRLPFRLAATTPLSAGLGLGLGLGLETTDHILYLQIKDKNNNKVKAFIEHISINCKSSGS